MTRKKIGLEEKLAAAVRVLLAIPYEHAKLMSATQMCSLVEWHHDIQHAIEPIDEHWNLTPLPIMDHRSRSPGDAALVRKSNRVRDKHRAHLVARDHQLVLADTIGDFLDRFEQQDALADGRWWSHAEGRYKPPIQSRGFDKTRTRGFDGKVRPRKKKRPAGATKRAFPPGKRR